MSEPTVPYEVREKVAELARYWREDCSGYPDTGDERLHIEQLIEDLEALC